MNIAFEFEDCERPAFESLQGEHRIKFGAALLTTQNASLEVILIMMDGCGWPLTKLICHPEGLIGFPIEDFGE